MSTLLVQAVALAAAVATLEDGTLLTYRGEIQAAREPGGSKQLTYRVVVAGEGAKGARLLWTVSEKGQGGWPWVEQFGEVEVDARGRIIAGKPASVLFTHAEGVSPVPLLPPVFAGPKSLAKGLKWRDGRLSHEVVVPENSALVKGAWSVQVTSPIGRKRTLHVEKDRPLVFNVDEVVFIGPGKEHRLKLSLADEKRLNGENVERALAVFASLTNLHQALKIKPQGGKVQWTDAQLARLKEELPPIVERAADTPWAELTLRAAGDARLQKGIAAAIEKLQKEYVGQAAPKLDLRSASLSGVDLKSAEIKGKPIVLHLWDYRDNPLVEPYGQTGYLDFLYRKHKADGVKVFGVAVDSRLDRPDARSAAVRSVRKLKSFMNLGYPIVLGGQETLSQFGDPGQFGAELPLTVVIDGEGKIAHYHVGLYKVDRDRGLAELDAAVRSVK